jgi:hypothetical protein
MAEARSLFDRSQLKTNDNIHGRSPSVSYLGSLATRRNVSCSSGDDGPIYMLSSNLACHSAGLSVHDLFTDIGTGFICRPSGHIETCLLCSSFSLRNIDSELLKFKHDQQKITKTSPLERERTLDIRRYFGEGMLFGFLL